MADGSKRGHKMLHDKNDQGCMHNFLRFADLHQRLRIRKALAYRSERNKSPKKKQNDMQDVSENVTQDVSDNVAPVGGYPDDSGTDSNLVVKTKDARGKHPKKKQNVTTTVMEERNKSPNKRQNDMQDVSGNVTQDVFEDVAPVGEYPNDLEKDSNLVAKTKENARGKASPNSLMKVLVFKKRFRGKHKRQNTASDESQILRTLSIHHLSSYDFVPPDELTLANEYPEDAFNSDESYCSSSNEVISTLTETTEGSSCRRQHGLYRSESTGDGVGSENEDSTIEFNADDESDCSSRIKALPNSLKTTEVSTTGIHRQLSRIKSSTYRGGQDHHGNHLVEKQSPVRKKLQEAEESSSMQIAAVAKELGIDAALLQSKEFMEMMQLFSANRELFLKFLHDPTIIFTDQAQMQNGSFSAAGRNDQKSLDHLQKEIESTCKQDKNLQDENSSLLHNVIEDGAQPVEPMADEDTNMHKGGISTSDSSKLCLEEQKDHKNVGIGSKHFKVLKKKIKSMINQHKTEHQRISRDSVLHKVPYGEKVSQNVMNPPSAEPEKSTSKGHFWKTGLSSFSCKHTFKKIMKPSSLTDSLGRYSKLLESVSRTEPNKSLGVSRSIKHGMEVENRMSTKSLARILSLPELRTDSLSKYTRNDVLNCQFEMQQGSGLVDSTIYVDHGDHSKVDLAAACRHSNESLKPVELLEQPSSFNEQEQLAACKDHNLSMVEERCYSNLNGASYGHEDTLRLDPEARTLRKHAEDLMLVPQTDSEIQTSPMKDDVEEPSDDLSTLRGTHDFNSIHIQVDEREEAEFSYVRNILHKSGFSSQQALAEWHLPDQPVDPLLFDEEEECFYQDPKFVVDEPMTTLKHMLLFDLINEVLLQTYDASFAYCPWVLHSDYQIRPLPVGHRVLQEVWAVISKHLSRQLQLNQTVESTVARDFMKNDGWMNLKHDIKYVGLDMGDLISEDLINEIVIDLVTY